MGVAATQDSTSEWRKLGAQDSAALHLEEGIGHRGKSQTAHTLGQRMDQHRVSFQW